MTTNEIKKDCEKKARALIPIGVLIPQLEMQIICSIVDTLYAEHLIVQKRVEDLCNALSAVQMLIEEDIEEDRGFTFNRKKMLEKIEEALK